jgi:hypothetical protein
VLQHVSVGRWSLDAYRDIVPEPILEGLREARIHDPQPAALPRLLMEELELLSSLTSAAPPRPEDNRA